MTLLGALLVIACVLAAIGQNVLADEAWGWLPRVAQAIVRSAARRLDGSRQVRYEEEWLAELAQFDERRLTGLGWAVTVWLSAGSMKAAASGEVSSAPDEKELPKVIASRAYVVDEWMNFVADLRQRDSADVDAAIHAATARFEARLVDVQSPALDRLAELKAVNRVRRDAAQAASISDERVAEPGFFERKPLPSLRRPPRRGPGGAADPEWTIAPLTRSERRAAESLRSALAGPDLAWPALAERALTSAVDDFDHRRGRGRRRRKSPRPTDVRLAVFLSAWSSDDDSASDVRVLPKPPQ